MLTPERITEALSAPFELREVRFKAQTVKGNAALAVAYVDVRVVQDRLDDVLGITGWQDEYEVLRDDSVMCKLKVKIGDEWLLKMDVGSPSEQPDGGDRLKAAFSDSLKRAAVKFGVGRYLYRLPLQWCDYDPTKKKFVSTPKLPAFALPKVSGTPRPEEAKGSGLPTTGKEMHERLRKKDSELAAQGRCMIGSLLAHVIRTGAEMGFPPDPDKWGVEGIQLASQLAKDFVAKLPQPEKAR